MLREIESQNIEFSTANLSLFDKSTIYTLGWRLDSFIETTNEAGYNGLEWHPTRFTRSGRQLRNGVVSDYEANSIVSLHQSYRSERNIFEAAAGGLFAIQSYILLPEMDASLDDLNRIQSLVGRQLPIVMDSHSDTRVKGPHDNFNTKLVQPSSEVMYHWKKPNIDFLTAEMYLRGYSGFCLDLAHIRRPDYLGYSMGPWQEALPQLLPHTKEIHLSAGRVDMPYENTLEELRDLIHGTNNTELPQIIQAIKVNKWSGRIVTEIPSKSLYMLRGQGGMLTVPQLIDDHRNILINTQALLA